MVIARFSLPKALALLVIGYGIVSLILFETFYNTSAQRLGDHIASKGEFWLPLLLMAWLFGIIFTLLLTALLVQVVAHSANAIWVDGEKLIYLNKFFIAVRRANIEKISLGSFGHWNRPAIIIELRGGAKKVIPTGALSEAVPVVSSRLQNWLGMKVGTSEP